MSPQTDWKNSDNIELILSKHPDIDKIKATYILKCFWSSAYLKSDYTPSNKWAEIITLTPYGNEILSVHLYRIKDEDAAITKFCLFRFFTYHDLLISPTESNLLEIASLLENEIIAGKIIFPYRFGRLLYDKYNDIYHGELSDHLPEAEVQKLLEHTPKGVYQLGNKTIGPLGLNESEENRYLPPSLKLPLWHCSDTGCGATHDVRLLSENSPVSILSHKIADIFREKFGQRSEWKHALYIICFRNADRSFGLQYRDIAALIADCMTFKEKGILVEAALKTTDGQVFRQLLIKSKNPTAGKGSPSEIIAHLKDEECFQLLLSLSDKKLIALIERCLDLKLIRIPPGQIRIAKNIPPLPSLSSPTKLSCFGLRSINDEPAVVMMRMIEQVYNECGKRADLNWRLKSSADKPIGIALCSFLRENGPEELVKSLILSSPDICNRFAVLFNISCNPIENSELFTNRLLWRMNFDPISRDSLISRFFERIDSFSNSLMKATEPLTERMKEEIRSAGVNLFVSVEEFIDRLLTFNIWLLSSDHFLDTRCIFDISKARSAVSNKLGAFLISDNQELSWNPDGSNTLGVLLRYLSESVTWINSLLEYNRELLTRPKEDFPFYSDSKAQVFLFKHRELWADMDPNLLRDFSNDYTSLCKLISQANLTIVRNGIDHMRDEDHFPELDTMIACASRLRQAVILADDKRYFPKVFWLWKFEQKLFGLHEYSFIDSNKNYLTITGPSMFCGNLTPTFGRPWIMAPQRICEHPNSNLLLKYQQSNEYDIYWGGYPRRRFIPPRDRSISDKNNILSCNKNEMLEDNK